MQASSPASPVDTKQRRWVETCLVLAQNRCCLMVSSLMLGDVWNQITDQTWSWDYEFPLQWWRESYFCTLLGTPLKAYCMHLERHWESDEEKVRAVSFRILTLRTGWNNSGKGWVVSLHLRLLEDLSGVIRYRPTSSFWMLMLAVKRSWPQQHI